MRLLLCVLIAAFPLTVSAAPTDVINSEAESFTLESVIEDLGVPWGLSWISDGELLITERQGKVRLLDRERAGLLTLRGVPEVMAEGQGGMLDVAVPPDFQRGEWIYFTFVRGKSGKGVTVLARARLRDGTLVDWQDVLETRSATDTTHHFGSRIAFDETGHVYFGVGDRGVRPTAQDLTSHNGAVMRITGDGKVPGDNPFAGRKGALPEIWSYGHRNPQGIAYDPEARRLWVIEHGPRGGDEINLVLPGRNYGWPIISYGKEYWGPVPVGEGTEREGMEQPVKQYTPSIAPGSLLLYDGKAFPKWRGNLFAGALRGRHLNRIVINAKGETAGEERLLEDLEERIRALAQSPQGWIYFSTDSGKLFCIKPVDD